MKPTPELTTRTNQIIIDFQAVQCGIKGDALAMKLKMFFAGLLVNELKEIHHELHGETRGGDQKSENSKSKRKDVSILIDPFLEQHLGVTARTCRNYHNFWLSIVQTTTHASTLQTLNKWWLEHRPSLRLPTAPQLGKAKDTASLAISTTSSEFASLAKAVTAANALLEEADTLGLHELFERPAKDVTPEVIKQTKSKSDERQLQLALQFWGPQGEAIRRLARKDYLHLPDPEREALVTTLEETIEELKETLKARRRS